MALDFPNSPTNGQTYSANNITWEYETSTTTWKVKQDGAAGKTRVASVKDVKPNADSGGQITANTWTTRDLNTISDPSNIGISVNTNVITIPAGTYRIKWKAPGWRIYTYQTKLEYSTDSGFGSGVTKVIGSSEFSSSTSAPSATSSEGVAPSLTFSETTYVRIRQWAGMTGPTGVLNGLGVASYSDVGGTNSGENNIFTVVEIEDLATVVKDNATYVEGNSRVALLKDQKSYNVHGGTFTEFGWRDRDLTVEEDPNNFVDFTSGGSQSSASPGNTPGYWSLPAGTYRIEWSAPGMNVNRHITKLVWSTTESEISTAGLDGDITTAGDYAQGSSENTTGEGSGTIPTATRSFGSKVINITETTWFKILHWCNETQDNTGFGQRVSEVNLSATDFSIYTQVKIEDLATAVKDNATYVEGTTKVAILRDQKNYDKGGGYFYGDYWRDRDLTVEEDPQSFVNFVPTTNGQTTESAGKTPGYWSLPAGTYEIQWGAFGGDVNRHQTRLVWSTTQSDMTWSSGSNNNTADNPPDETSRFGTNECFGSSENVTESGGDSWTGTWSKGTKVITITQTTYFKVLHICGIDDAEGFGSKVDNTNFSPDRYTTGKNIYAEVRIVDLATAVKNEQTVSIIKQIQHANGPATQQTYNDTSSWTTIVEKNITLSASNNVLVNVKAGFYGGDEGEVFNSGRLIRTTSSSDTNLWEYASVWGRAGTLKASFDGPSVVDTPGTGTHTYKWQTKRNTSQGSNNVLVPANGNSITLTEYT